MAYPESPDHFYEKLNKKQDGSLYLIEEEIKVNGGVYEGLLAHDTITPGSIRVFTGPEFSGEEVTQFVVSIPSEASWQRRIKLFSDISPVYVSYTTPGDTVEAQDINVLQNSLLATQGEIERYKEAGIIDGGYFTGEVE